MEASGAFVDMLRTLERSGFGDGVRNVPYLYPVLESLHVLGIAVLVGPAVGVDLRLLGVGRNVLPVTKVTRYLLPLSHLGFALAAVTGLTMFAGVAQSVGTSGAGALKLSLLVVAALNILLFHRGVYRGVASWDVDVPAPRAARVAAWVSALTWLGVIVAGRFLAY
jgi:hypothetical protein